MPTVSPALRTLTESQTFDEDDWKESIGTYQPGGGDSFTKTMSEATLVGIIDASRRIDAVRFFCGYSQADDGDPWRLRRTNPPTHPSYPWMHSTGVSFTQFSPRGNTGNVNNEPWIEAVGDGPLSYAGKYAKAQAQVRFSQLPFPVLTDDELDADPFLQGQDSTGAYTGFPLEVYRNCIIYDGVEPSFNLLQADGSPYLEYYETATGGPTIGQAFPAPLGVPLCKVAFAIKWVDVCDEYIFGNEYVPNKIVNGLGKVNSNWFLGFAPGVLWLSAVRFERFTPPLYAISMPAISWNVSFVFEFFDPEKGVPASEFRGHNLMPWRNDGLFYAASRTDVAYVPYLGSYDYNKLFEHNNKP